MLLPSLIGPLKLIYRSDGFALPQLFRNRLRGHLKPLFVDASAGLIRNQIANVVLLALFEALFIVHRVLRQLRQDFYESVLECLGVGPHAESLVDLVHFSILRGEFLAFLSEFDHGKHAHPLQVVVEFVDECLLPGLLELLVFGRLFELLLIFGHYMNNNHSRNYS